MSDMAKVIKGLEETETALKQAVDRGGEMSLIKAYRCECHVGDAIALLKEYETIEPDVDSEGTCSCGNCGMTVGYYPVGCSVPEKLCKYCPECGHGVKWK